MARVDGRETRVFADLWDVERFADCQLCLTARRERLRAMNIGQRLQPLVSCPRCGHSSVNIIRFNSRECPPLAADPMHASPGLPTVRVAPTTRETALASFDANDTLR